MTTIKKLWNELATRINQCNRELSKAIGKKSVYNRIDITHEFLTNQWIDFNYSQELTKEEKQMVIKILTKYFGKLDRPEFTKKYKTERDIGGDLRWDNYSFLSYLMRYKEIK